MDPTTKTLNSRKQRTTNISKLERTIDMLRAKGVTKFKNDEFEIELVPNNEVLHMEIAPQTYQVDTKLSPGASVPSMWTEQELEKLEFLHTDLEAGIGAD